MEKNLPPKQLMAVGLLADGLPVKIVAERLDISLSLLYKWLKLPAFNSHLNGALREKNSKAFQDVFALKPVAVETFKELLNSKNAMVKMKAAEMLLKFGM